MTTRPFERGRFGDLPELARRPHSFFAIPQREIRVRSGHFGAVDIAYRELGEGPPLLLVHGLMTTSYSFRYVIDELARDYRVIALDLPGCGRSDKPDVAYGGEALAVFLTELQRALGVRGCLAVGNSMGGYLCMRAALRDERAFSRLVNIHSPGVPDLRYDALHALLAIPALRALLVRVVRASPERWAHANVHYYDESLKSREEAREYGAPLATSAGALAFTRYLSDTFAPAELRGFVDELAARRRASRLFPVPLMLLYSRQDPLVPPEVGARLHRLVPEASFEWLDETSHFAHVDTPEQVLASVLPFLRER